MIFIISLYAIVYSTKLNQFSTILSITKPSFKTPASTSIAPTAELTLDFAILSITFKSIMFIN